MTSIIAIRGVYNTGKTTTAWLVYLLLRNYATSIRFWFSEQELGLPPYKIVARNVNNVNPQWEQVTQTSALRWNHSQLRDFVAIMTINNRVYVINSAGDNEDIIIGGIRRALCYVPDGIILCSRTRGKSNIINVINKKYPHLLLKIFGLSKTSGTITDWKTYLSDKINTATTIVSHIIPDFNMNSKMISDFIDGLIK